MASLAYTLQLISMRAINVFSASLTSNGFLAFLFQWQRIAVSFHYSLFYGCTLQLPSIWSSSFLCRLWKRLMGVCSTETGCIHCEAPVDVLLMVPKREPWRTNELCEILIPMYWCKSNASQTTWRITFPALIFFHMCSLMHISIRKRKFRRPKAPGNLQSRFWCHWERRSFIWEFCIT